MRAKLPLTQIPACRPLNCLANTKIPTPRTDMSSARAFCFFSRLLYLLNAIFFFANRSHTLCKILFNAPQFLYYLLSTGICMLSIQQTLSPYYSHWIAFCWRRENSWLKQIELKNRHESNLFRLVERWRCAVTILSANTEQDRMVVFSCLFSLFFCFFFCRIQTERLCGKEKASGSVRVALCVSVCALCVNECVGIACDIKINALTSRVTCNFSKMQSTRNPPLRRMH